MSRSLKTLPHNKVELPNGEVLSFKSAFQAAAFRANYELVEKGHPAEYIKQIIPRRHYPMCDLAMSVHARLQPFSWETYGGQQPAEPRPASRPTGPLIRQTRPQP